MGIKCPIFLFFSVNSSGQFVGVTEMVGPVDFAKDMRFCKLDKYNGFFPIKWHIIRDVPNHQLRHIILDGNENRNVTFTRDTQEVLDMINDPHYLYQMAILHAISLLAPILGSDITSSKLLPLVINASKDRLLITPFVPVWCSSVRMQMLMLGFMLQMLMLGFMPQALQSCDQVKMSS